MTESDAQSAKTTQDFAELWEAIGDEYGTASPERGDILEGTIVQKGGGEILVDVGAKQEALVSSKDLARMSQEEIKELRLGAKVKVYILRPQDRDGNLLVSINLAKAQQDWITAAELMEKLDLARTTFWEGMTDEERQALYAQWRERLAPPDQEQAGPMQGGPGGMQGGPGGMQGGPDGMQPFGRGGMLGFGNQEMPGGGVADMRQLAEQAGGPEGRPDPAAEGGPGGPGGRGGFGGFMNYEDELRGLLMPARFDTISLDLQDVSLADAVQAFTAASGFLVIVDQGIDGTVTLQLEDEEAEEAVAALAAAVGAQWRPFYLLGQPRELTQPEVAERQQQFEQRRQQFGQQRDQMFARMLGEFWQMSPQDRAQRVQQMAERIESIPPERMQRAQRMMSRMLPRVTDYASTLTPEQRLELKPLLQAMARVAGQ